MIKKISRPKQLNNQDKQAPKTIQELMQRYDLDNKGVCDYLDYLIEYLIQQKQEIENNKVSKNGDTMTGVLSNTTAFQIPKNYSQGYGLTNSDGVSIIRDHGNQNVTVDATGKDLYLGFENTQNINILRDKYLITENALILNNASFLDGIDENGNYIHLIRAVSDTIAIGASNKQVNIWSNKVPNVILPDRVATLATKEQNILWKDDTGAYMNDSQTAPLSQKVSEQNNGIVLQFRAYTGDTNNKYWYNYIFIPKTHVLYYNGGGVDCFITADNFSVISHKYIYVQDTQLIGHIMNVNSGTKNGITFDNTKFVLTAVIGV